MLVSAVWGGSQMSSSRHRPCPQDPGGSWSCNVRENSSQTLPQQTGVGRPGELRLLRSHNLFQYWILTWYFHLESWGTSSTNIRRWGGIIWTTNTFTWNISSWMELSSKAIKKTSTNVFDQSCLEATEPDERTDDQMILSRGTDEWL